MPNQEPAFAEPFGNGLKRLSSQGLFPPYLTLDASIFAAFTSSRPNYLPLAWVSEDGALLAKEHSWSISLLEWS